MELIETIELAIIQSEGINPNIRSKLKLSLRNIREQVQNNNDLSLKEEDFYFESFHVQTEDIELNNLLNKILHLLCVYLSRHPIDNSSQS